MNAASNTSKQFMTVWSGQLVSGFGSGLTAFTLGIYVFQQTQAVTDFALLTMCSFLPSVVLRPLAGIFVDRYDRLNLMIMGDLAALMVPVALLILFKTMGIALPDIYVACVVNGLFLALQSTAYKSLVTDLLPEELYGKASGLVQLAGSAQYLLAPVAAGFLVGRVDISLILLMNAGAYLLAALATIMVKAGHRRPKAGRRPEVTAWTSEFKAAWAAVAQPRGILSLTLILTLTTYLVGLIQVLFGPLLLTISDPAAYGRTMSICASGLLAGSLMVSLIKFNDLSRQLLVGLGLCGLFLSLLGFSSGILRITLTGFCFFAVLPLVNAGAEVLIRKNIPNEMQGRAWGVIGLISQAGYLAAFGSAGFLMDSLSGCFRFEGGLLASLLGPGSAGEIRAVFVLAGFFLLLLCLASIKNRPIRLLAHAGRA